MFGGQEGVLFMDPSDQQLKKGNSYLPPGFLFDKLWFGGWAEIMSTIKPIIKHKTS